IEAALSAYYGEVDEAARKDALPERNHAGCDWFGLHSGSCAREARVGAVWLQQRSGCSGSLLTHGVVCSVWAGRKVRPVRQSLHQSSSTNVFSLTSRLHCGNFATHSTIRLSFMP